MKENRKGEKRTWLGEEKMVPIVSLVPFFLSRSYSLLYVEQRTGWHMFMFMLTLIFSVLTVLCPLVSAHLPLSPVRYAT